jgi:acyl dehydratase
MLRRGKGGEGDQKSYGDRTPDPTGKPGPGGVEFDAPRGVLWKLDGDLGRRYGAVSGDRNPIHMHSLTAKPLGFPRAIAHGMWTKARCLAALESRLPDAFEAGVRFRKPIFLPGRVEFVSAEDGDGKIEFAVRDSKKKTPHLDGRVTPLEGK